MSLTTVDNSPRSTNWSRPVTSMMERRVVLQLTARWCGLDSRLYLLTKATLGRAYLMTILMT